MLNSEENESPPLILSETNKLVDTLEASDVKIYQLKDLLGQKQNYLDQLDQNNNDELKFLAKKQTDSSVSNWRANMVDMENTKFRNGAKKAYDSFQEVCQYINNLESDFVECEDKFKNFGNKLNNDTNQYEKQIDDLIRLLDQLTEKRSKKLASLETQKERFFEEKIKLEQQSFNYENQMDPLTYDTDSENEALENEVQELERKLSILNDDYSRLNCDEKNCEDVDLASGKYSELDELEKRFAQINNEVIQTTKDLETQEFTESELRKSAPTLDDYEAKLNKEMQETSKFWNDLDLSPYEGFSKIEQEISKIKADIIERKEKYEDVKNNDLKCTEKIHKKNEEIEDTNSKVAQLSSELKEMENELNNLETSTYYSEQYNMMTREIEDLHKEKEQLNNFIATKENGIKETITQLKKEIEKGDLDLISLENNNLMEVRKFEKDCDEVEGAKAALQQNAQSAENKLKELEELNKNYYDMQLSNSEQNKQLDVAIGEAEASMKLAKIKKGELKAKLGTATVPSPIYVKANDQNFAKPKTNDFFKRKMPHIQGAAASKRNWDSDSSMEAEEIKMNAYLKKKYRKRPDAENKKKIQNEL